jgi:hypothetical protein
VQVEACEIAIRLGHRTKLQYRRWSDRRIELNRIRHTCCQYQPARQSERDPRFGPHGESRIRVKKLVCFKQGPQNNVDLTQERMIRDSHTSCRLPRPPLQSGAFTPLQRSRQAALSLHKGRSRPPNEAAAFTTQEHALETPCTSFLAYPCTFRFDPCSRYNGSVYSKTANACCYRWLASTDIG